MGSFVIAQDVIDLLGVTPAAQLTTDSGNVADSVMIDGYIVRVEGRILSAVTVRTSDTITQATHPQSYEAIRGAVLDMVRFGLAARRPPVSDDWRTANDKAEQWLKDLIAGTVTLPDVAQLDSQAESHSIATDMTVENWP